MIQMTGEPELKFLSSETYVCVSVCQTLQFASFEVLGTAAVCEVSCSAKLFRLVAFMAWYCHSET